jgi:hypothetical protein
MGLTKRMISARIGATALAFASLLATPASAADITQTEVDGVTLVAVRVDSNGRGLLYFPPDTSGGHGPCRASYNNHILAFDANTAGGRAILQLARAAHLYAMPVHIVGTGSCDIYAPDGIEDVLRFYIMSDT